MSVCLLVMTDGREHVTDAIRSAEANLTGPITHRVIHDDSGCDNHRAWLARTFPDYRVIYKLKRQGFGGAYANAWRYVSQLPVRWVFGLEDDFILDRTVALDGMAAVLTDFPNLHQMALRRQPWSPEEKAAGGIVEQHPGDYTDKHVGSAVWLEHRRFFTTNPSLYRRELTEVGWPEVPQSEGHFTRVLTADPEARFGYWGARDSGEWVTHVGHQRVGHGY